MNIRLFVLPFALLLTAAFSLAPAHASNSYQLSVMANGQVNVAADGSVSSYSLKEPDQLPPKVLALLQNNIPHWRFKPMIYQGEPRAATADMNIRVVAKPKNDKQYVLSIAGARFTPSESTRTLPGSRVRYDNDSDRQPPRYPRSAIRARVGGNVYLVVEIDKSGHVLHVAAEQVNLRVSGKPRVLESWREALATASVEAARDWTFAVPTIGPNANKDHWTVRIPVNFRIRELGEPKQRPYGQWIAYTPGPLQDIPWLDADQHMNGSVDVFSGNGAIYLANNRRSPQLLTELGG